LASTGAQSDFVVAPAAAAFYEPRITPNLYGLIDVREQLFYYDRFPSFNFGSFDVEVGIRHILPQWHNLLLRVDYDYNRLTEKNSFAAFFQNHGFIANAENSLPLWPRSTAFFGGRREYQHGGRGVPAGAPAQRKCDFSAPKRL
jgi:hypothetical protein